MAAIPLPRQIAFMISQNPTQCMHPNFFEKLDQELRKRGFRLVAHQRGVQGTHICIDRVEEPK